MMHTKDSPRIGDVFIVNFEGSGTEQSGVRPAVIFQNDDGNRNSPNVIVLPLTSSIKKMNMPTHVLINAEDTGLLVDSVVLCENPKTIVKNKLGKYITTLPSKYMHDISVASIVATGALNFITHVDIALLEN